MKDFKVVFEQDMELCYDGVNPRQYKKGQAYSPTHAHEKRMFDAFLADGRASLPSKEVKKEEPIEKEKISTPKEKKSKKKK